MRNATWALIGMTSVVGLTWVITFALWRAAAG